MRKIAAAVAVGACALGLLPALSSAAPSAPTDARSERERIRREQAEVASEIDVLEASDDEVSAALDALNANVAGEQAALADSERLLPRPTPTSPRPAAARPRPRPRSTASTRTSSRWRSRAT